MTTQRTEEKIQQKNRRNENQVNSQKKMCTVKNIRESDIII